MRAKKAEADAQEAARRSAEAEEAADEERRRLQLDSIRRVAEAEAATAEERRQLQLDSARRVAEAEAATAEAQGRAATTRALDESHEAFRRERAATITANLGALRLLRGDEALSPRSLRAVEDELRTGLLGTERCDASLGRPIYLSASLAGRLLLKEGPVQTRASVFGKMVMDAVRIAHPDYSPDMAGRSVRGRNRPINVYYEAHLETIETVLPRYLAATTPIRDDELTATGLAQRRAARAASSVGAMLLRAPQ